MTMADTVAVMNQGRIEQLGAPIDLYESPQTTFVANFLGQSNLVPATRKGSEEGVVVVDCQGQLLHVPAGRLTTDQSAFLVGVRPEKIRLADPGADASGMAATAALNRLTGGRIVDASFSGVSTQYLVRMPWEQELMVFAQNLEVGDLFPAGSAVDLVWQREHTFGLVGDRVAGVE